MRTRRRFLAAAGLSTGLLAGCAFLGGGREDRTETAPPTRTTREGTRTGTATESTETATDTRTSTDTGEGVDSSLRERFDTVHDVTEAGADPTGEQRVDDIVQNLVGHDTLLYFPQGRYRVGSISLYNVDNVGLYGPEATLDLSERGRDIYLIMRDMQDVFVDGFTIDNTGRNQGAAVDLKCTGGTNVVRNYAVEGFVDVPQRTFAFTLMIQGRDTALTLENVDLSRGGRNAGGAFVFPQQDFYNPNLEPGTLTFKDCVMRGWGKEGLYASAHSGPLRIIGGEYANNAIVQIRVGGGNAPTRAVVRDARIEVTRIPDYVPAGNRLLRGIWLKEGDGALIENCDVQVHNLRRSQTEGAIVVNEQFGRATIRDCSISSSVPRPAIVAERYDPAWMPSLDSLPEEWEVTVEDTSITGSISDIEAIHLTGRDGCTLRNVTVDRPGEGADGLRLDDAHACRIVDSEIETSQYPLVVELDGTTLRGDDGSQADETLASAPDRRFCVGVDPIQGTDPGPRQLLGLTRTAAVERTRSETTAGGSGDDSDGASYVLLGRLFER